MKKDGVGSVYFPIIPTALGKIPLHATARSSAAADSVQRELLIEVFQYIDIYEFMTSLC